MIKEGKKCFIRPIESDDWPYIKEWYYEGHYNSFFRDVYGPCKDVNFKGYEDMRNGMCFMIYKKHDGKVTCETYNNFPVIGMAIIYDIQWMSKVAKVAVLIDQEHQKEKISGDAFAIIIDYLTKNMGIKKIVVEMIKGHPIIQRLETEYGFKKEGEFENEAFFDGEFHDITRVCAFDYMIPDMLRNYWR